MRSTAKRVKQNSKNPRPPTTLPSSPLSERHPRKPSRCPANFTIARSRSALDKISAIAPTSGCLHGQTDCGASRRQLASPPEGRYCRNALPHARQTWHLCACTICKSIVLAVGAITASEKPLYSCVRKRLRFRPSEAGSRSAAVFH